MKNRIYIVSVEADDVNESHLALVPQIIKERLRPAPVHVQHIGMAKGPVNSVPAFIQFLELLRESSLMVLDNWHPFLEDSLTIVDPDTGSAFTMVTVESDATDWEDGKEENI